MSIEERPAESVANKVTDQGATMEPQEPHGVRRLSPLNDVVFSCIFDDVERTGPSMKEFLNAVLASEGEELIAEIVEIGRAHV